MSNSQQQQQQQQQEEANNSNNNFEDNNDDSMDGHPEIDEALYSRQLYVLGHEAMRRMQVCVFHLYFEIYYNDCFY